MFVDIGHLGCLIVLSPQKPLPTVWVRVVSWHFLGICTFFSIAPHPPLPRSFLSGLLALLLIPSIHFPTHPPIHPSIHTSTHHPPIHSSRNGRVDEWDGGRVNGWVNGCMSEWTGRWLMDGWLDAWVCECVCWLIVSSSLGLREINPRQRPPCR